MCDNVFGDICVRHFVYDQNIPLTTYARWETVQMRRKTRNSNNFNGSQIGSFNTNDRYDWKDVNSSKYSRVSMEWKMKTADQSRWEWNDWKNAKTKVDIKMQRAMKMDNVWVYTQPLKQRIINIFKVCMEKVMSPHLNRNRSSILISFRLPPPPSLHRLHWPAFARIPSGPRCNFSSPSILFVVVAACLHRSIN